MHTFASIIVFFQKTKQKKQRYVTHKGGGGGGPPICYGLLKGGGGGQKWPKSCYVICEWPLTENARKPGYRFEQEWNPKNRVKFEGCICFTSGLVTCVTVL